ncbi:LysE family translocator [Salinisphaera sp. LB1]|uniref:LysE family translocator n=1 Tax=Salinisphaera sp. LB1 TaxID=2183911 RepID=UPI000D705489|nr:LysE family transporter [Salinisphaera sp. LB1]AWN15331.1 Threonine efflux protein [Salinisphaera sp. LB1]
MHQFIALGSLWLLAAISPGPNFVLVARTAARHRARASLFAVAGIASATLVWGLAGALGIRGLFLAAPWAYIGLKLVGGAYLIGLGLAMLRASTRPGDGPPRAHDQPAARALFRTGLITNLANPKTAVFVSSLFATVMPPQASIGWSLAAVVMMALISASWYAVVALVLSRPPALALFSRVRTAFDRLVGIALAGFGTHLILSNAR